jgi:hypothetical protein
MAGDKRTMRTNGTPVGVNVRNLRRDDKPAWRAWVLPLAMIALWCSPALIINVTHGLQSGREPALIVAAVFSVFGAAMCGLRLETQGSVVGRAIAGGCLAVLITFNFSNAVGLSAGHRDQARSEALTQQSTRGSLTDDARTINGAITKLDKELGASSVSSIRAEIAAAEYSPLFSRSRKCADATLSESRAHCQAWEKARAMLSAAEQRDKLRGELAAINEQLRAAPVRESVDPQSEAIVQALAFAGFAVQQRDVGYGLVLLFALGIELMAAFGASWCGVRLPAPVQSVNTVLAAVKPAAMPKATQATESPLTAFIGDLVRCDRATPFKALYEMYEAACRTAGAEPESRRAVGLALSRRFDKVKGGDAAYFARCLGTPIGVNKTNPRPCLAAVATAA